MKAADVFTSTKRIPYESPEAECVSIIPSQQVLLVSDPDNDGYGDDNNVIF